MGILDRLRNKKNITEAWVRDPAMRIAFDLGTGALCGVALAESAERLAFLGPAEVRKAALEGHLIYRTLGLSIGVTDGHIDDITLWWRDYLDLRLTPYAGRVTLSGRDLAFGSHTSEDHIVSALGKPYWKDRDQAETILFYELKDRWGRLTERQVELDEEGKLKAVVALAEPLLAREDQRKAYGIDKAWPPP